MSHVVMQRQIYDNIDAIVAGAKACGLVKLEKRKFKWYGAWVNDYNAADAAHQHGIKPEDYGKCEFALGIPGDSTAYEVGVVKNPSGAGYVLVWDFYRGGYGLMDKIGEDGGKLKVEINSAAVIAVREQMGDRLIATEDLADGSRLIRLRPIEVTY